jgi:hypothetical protein
MPQVPDVEVFCQKNQQLPDEAVTIARIIRNQQSKETQA